MYAYSKIIGMADCWSFHREDTATSDHRSVYPFPPRMRQHPQFSHIRALAFLPVVTRLLPHPSDLPVQALGGCCFLCTGSQSSGLPTAKSVPAKLCLPSEKALVFDSKPSFVTYWNNTQSTPLQETVFQLHERPVHKVSWFPEKARCYWACEQS